MTHMGEENIPVSGSKAAAKRKERLEFQVPLHDLDASLCHNLSENEAAQLTQYVEKIKENSVGQGVVIRLGDAQKPTIGYTSSTPQVPEPKATAARLVNDKILSAILMSQPIQCLLHEPTKVISGSKITVSSQPLQVDIDNNLHLSAKNKSKLKDIGINSDAIHSYVTNEPIYEQIFNNLKKKRVRFEDDYILGPMHRFHEEYLTNDAFKNSMQEFVESMKFEDAPESSLATATQQPYSADIFNSPVASPAVALRRGSVIQQETPVRKINFTQKAGTHLPPPAAAVKRDKILSDILNSEEIRKAIYYPTTIKPNSRICLSNVPFQSDFVGNPYLSANDKQFLQAIKIDSKALQSNIINGLIYDKLFQDLDECFIDYQDCCILHPMKALRLKYTNNGDNEFRTNVNNLVASLELEQPIGVGSVAASRSCDSGFDSAPPTPNYATHPLHNQHGVPKLTPINDNFNLASLMDTLELDDLPLPPSIPVKCELNQPIEGTITQANEEVSTLKTAAKCKSCLKDIYAGTVAVKAERAGKEATWHPQCFTCHTCGDLLADLVYFFHADNIYCGRDLAHILKIPRCNACDELIFTKEYTAAEGATFHIKHFCCFHCDIPLAGHQYIPDEKTNMPLCLSCYDQYYAAKCQYCQRVIGPNEEGVNFDKLHWHKTCFVCSGVRCGKSLIGGRFCIRNNLPFCSPACVASVCV